MALSSKIAVISSLALLLAVTFLANQAPPLLAASASVPINLTKDAVLESVPSIAVSPSGDVVVAWETNLSLNKNPQDIFAAVSTGGGPFGPKFKVSSTPSPSRDPFLFPVGASSVYVLYRDTLGASGYSVMDSIWNGITWTVPIRLTKDFPNSVDPSGVQASDGSIWIIRQVSDGATATDAIVNKIGGTLYNLSKDGSAVIRPAITAGDNGNLYAAWVDHANEYGHPIKGINVVRWNGTKWLPLPAASGEADAQFPRLAYYNQHLYLVWRSVSPVWSIKERVWDGTKWGPVQVLKSQSGITYPRLAVSSAGNVYVAWEAAGGIYLKINSNTPLLVSPGVSNAHQPALFVDAGGAAHVAFENGDIWYNKITYP